MKHLKTLLIFVMGIIILNTHYAASVTNSANTTSYKWHVIPKTKVKKEKLHKKEKVYKKQSLKKILGGGGMSSTLAILLCIFLFPLAFLWVGLYTNWEGVAWVITLLLEILFFIPAIIYAIIVIASN